MWQFDKFSFKKRCALILTTAVFGLLCTPLTQAQTSTSLSRWVSHSGAPELAATLAQHPKFKGERLRFGSIQRQQPTPHQNALLQSISEEFVHHVLRGGVNDVMAAADATCGIPRDADYFIGTSLEHVGNQTYRLRVQALDLVSRSWVGGISLSWQGRLSRSELQALAKDLRPAQPGSANQPLRGPHDPALSKLLDAQLSCANLNQLVGTVTLPTTQTSGATADPDHQALMQLVQSQIANRVHMTPDDQPGDWQLKVLHNRTGAVQHFRFNLQATSGQRTIRLAEFYLRSTPSPGVAEGPRATEQPTTPVYTNMPAAQGNLLGRIKPSRARECRDCVSFNLKRDSYIAVFSTIGNRLVVPQCSTPVRWRSADTIQYRVKDRNKGVHSSRPQYGFYVLASYDVDVLEQLGALLLNSASSCGGNLAKGLPQLLAAIDAAGADVDWQAYHATQIAGG